MNEEYLSYVDYLKSVNFEKKLEILGKKYDGKKIVLFGIGMFLDAILDNYDIKKYLNIIGISDKRFDDDQDADYKGFNTYKPLALRALKFNVVLDTNILFEDTKKYLKKNYYINKYISVEKIIQIPFSERLDNLKLKIKSIYNYLTASKNIFTTIKYSILCNSQELICKTNYIKKLKAIRASLKPIRTVFVCSDIMHTDFVGLYNLLYFDKDFKVFPIIVIPDILLDTELINEDAMQKKIEYFKVFNMDIIDGIDRETRELACIHAFKPDLIFYQKPIHIKDDFNPLNMSEIALTFTVEYATSKADFASLGSEYFRKQVSNLWKVFVNSKEDANLYAEYTNIKNKDIIKHVNKNMNTSIVKTLKNLFKKD